ncbi:TPA: hypothetical protein ACM7BO_000577 [Escherichia coli]
MSDSNSSMHEEEDDE